LEIKDIQDLRFFFNEYSLINANKELIGIFEQKIKDRIGKVWGGSATLTTLKSTPNPAPKSPKGDLESANKEMLMAAEPVVEYGKKKMSLTINGK